ncbi:MAG: hypothetical protein H6625_07940 [Bdellovibrionaceae bacterium]|nr:hypothetical protein [Pseudobdellovibrionaceae bacterium]
MAKKKKDFLVDELVDEINKSSGKDTHNKAKGLEPHTGSAINFADFSSSDSDEVIELDIELPPSKEKELENEEYSKTEIYDAPNLNEGLNEEELVQAYEETLATELLEASENIKMEEENKDHLDHTEKVDMDLFDVSSPYQSAMRPLNSTESKLADAESLKIAQNKIKELRMENEKISIENEELAAAAETFRNKVDFLEAQVHNYGNKYKDLNENVVGEKEILLKSMSEKDKELNRVRQKAEELEARLQTGLRKIKVRERELENRLELVKLESKALINSKDEMILNLKRQLDNVSQEIEFLRNKIQESNKYFNQKQEVMRKTVKTLRLALSLLETEEFNNPMTSLKKAE